MNHENLSRRRFVQATGAAIAGSGVLAAEGASAAQSAQIDLPMNWHASSDVVVVGFGAAGAAAAYEAAKAGATVTILDTSAAGGGDTAISGGFIFMGGGTGLQQGAGYSETPEQMYQVVRAMGGDGADPDLIMTWCQRSPELYGWLTSEMGMVYDAQSLTFSGMEQHAEFRPLAPSGTAVPHCHWEVGVTVPTAGASLFAKLSAATLGSRRVQFMSGFKAIRLIQHPINRRVVGVVAREVDSTGQFVSGGQERFFRASKAVVIATGAFSANAAMMVRHNPNLLSFHHWSQSNADGSGIRIVQKAGGDVRLMKAWWCMGFFAAVPTTSKGVLVNPQGSRFVAEDGTYYWIGYHMVAMHPTAYSIFDQTALGSQPPDANALSANTIEALADAINQRDNIGMPRELLKATVDGYNVLANADGQTGRDPAFLKAPQFVLPIVTPPFYAMRYTGVTDLHGTTGGGLRISTRAEVLDPEGTPIPGLYAAGTCTSSTISERYTGSGTAIAGALVFGRIAGQQAATLTRWSL